MSSAKGSFLGDEEAGGAIQGSSRRSERLHCWHARATSILPCSQMCSPFFLPSFSVLLALTLISSRIMLTTNQTEHLIFLFPLLSAVFSWFGCRSMWAPAPVGWRRRKVCSWAEQERGGSPGCGELVDNPKHIISHKPGDPVHPCHCFLCSSICRVSLSTWCRFQPCSLFALTWESKSKIFC